MLKINIFSILLLIIILLSGCVGTYKSKKRSNLSIFNTKIGTATSIDIKQKARRLLDRYQFQVVRFEETSDEIYIETQWNYRTPFEDEYHQGVVNARTRFIIITNPRTRAYAGGPDLHVVSVRGENEVRLVDKDNWINLPLTDMVIAYFNKFAGDLKTELSMGIRKY